MYRYNYAAEFARSIRCGWNLGNTFDSLLSPEHPDCKADTAVHETAWGNPIATWGQLEAIRDAGFDALRIPVTWTHHLGAAPDYRIEERWLSRVDTIVREAFSLGFRVILNVHHDASPGWGELSLAADALDESERILCAVWTQLAEHFSELGESLLFEVLNEPRIGDDWVGTPEGYAAVNRLNAAAVRAIRAVGGCNPCRYLILPTYAATSKVSALDALELPEDERLMVSIHAYQPTAFCFPPKDVTWTTPQETWGSKADIDLLLTLFHQLEKRFLRRGIPVILGEMAAGSKQDAQSRLLWAAVYTKEATARCMPCFWWDDGNLRPGQMGLFDRRKLTWTDPALVSLLTGKLLPDD